MTPVCLPRRSASDMRKVASGCGCARAFNCHYSLYCVQFLGLCVCVRALCDKQLPLPQRSVCRVPLCARKKQKKWEPIDCVDRIRMESTAYCGDVHFSPRNTSPRRPFVCVPMDNFVCATVSIQLKTFNIHQLINEPINATRSKHFVPSRQTHRQRHTHAAHLFQRARTRTRRANIYAQSIDCNCILLLLSTVCANCNFSLKYYFFHIFSMVDLGCRRRRCREIVSPVVYGIEAEIARIMFDFL